MWLLLKARPKTEETDCQLKESPLTPTKHVFISKWYPGSLVLVQMEIKFSNKTAPVDTAISLLVTLLPLVKYDFGPIYFPNRWITAPGASCRWRSTLGLAQKWALWSKPFGRCWLPKWGDGRAKLPHGQAACGEGLSWLLAALKLIFLCTI